jgi:hypothetical protein
MPFPTSPARGSSRLRPPDHHLRTTQWQVSGTELARKRHTSEEIIRKFRAMEVELGRGLSAR